MKMKRPEDMSREELIEEIISVSKRLEETDRQIAELSKQEELRISLKSRLRETMQ